MAEIKVNLSVSSKRLQEALEQMAERMREGVAQAVDGVAKSMNEVVRSMSRADVSVIAAAIRKAEKAAEQSAADDEGFMVARVVRVRGCTPMQSLAKQVRCVACDWADVWDGSPHVKCKLFGFKTDTRRPAREPGHQTLCAAFIAARPRSCLNCVWLDYDLETLRRIGSKDTAGICRMHEVTGNLTTRTAIVSLDEAGTEPCTVWRPKPPHICSACRLSRFLGSRDLDWLCTKIRTGSGDPLVVPQDNFTGMHCRDFKPDLQAIASKQFADVESWQMSWFDSMEIADSGEVDDVPF